MREFSVNVGMIVELQTPRFESEFGVWRVESCDSNLQTVNLVRPMSGGRLQTLTAGYSALKGFTL